MFIAGCTIEIVLMWANKWCELKGALEIKLDIVCRPGVKKNLKMFTCPDDKYT